MLKNPKGCNFDRRVDHSIGKTRLLRAFFATKERILGRGRRLPLCKKKPEEVRATLGGIDFPARRSAERAREPGDRRDSELGSDIKLKRSGGTSRGKGEKERETRAVARRGRGPRARLNGPRAAVHTCGFRYALYVL